MTLQQQAIKVVQVLPDEKLPTLIQFARFLQSTSSDLGVSVSKSNRKTVRKAGRLKGQIWMAEDFNETPEEFKEYL